MQRFARRRTLAGPRWSPRRTRPARVHISTQPDAQPARSRAARGTAAVCFPRSSWKKADLNTMTIKSDHWIRRMAKEHRMIEPFAAEQVRHADGERIVSYGTSSYGYDVRCASEFKIFTNINSTIVDPKKFDAKSFVDFSGDVCIIPPNSFALARTVEYFRVPRNALVVCLGKSTYA